MRTNIVFTFIGDDQPGLVDRISKTVGQHNGNWLESRLSRLAGKFAGIIQVGVAEENAADLTEALSQLSGAGLAVLCEQCDAPAEPSDSRSLRLEVFGLDRRDIVHEISHALATRGVNVAEMSTEITPAAMTGEIMFVAEAIIEVPGDVDIEELDDQLDEIGRELTVDIDLIRDSD